MNYITTTQLRTDTPELIQALLDGYNIDLIHRSRIIGEIRQKKPTELKIIDAASLKKTIEDIDFPKLTLNEIDKRYRQEMTKKHGQNIH